LTFTILIIELDGVRFCGFGARIVAREETLLDLANAVPVRARARGLTLVGVDLVTARLDGL